jgi:hypothetical protein
MHKKNGGSRWILKEALSDEPILKGEKSTRKNTDKRSGLRQTGTLHTIRYVEKKHERNIKEDEAADVRSPHIIGVLECRAKILHFNP